MERGNKKFIDEDAVDSLFNSIKLKNRKFRFMSIFKSLSILQISFIKTYATIKH